jgi:hypothetical protein
MPQPMTPARKIGQVLALILMVLGIAVIVIGGMIQHNTPLSMGGGVLFILGTGLFFFCEA